MKEMQQYLGVLRQLKDFDENLSREIAAKAYQEQERIKLEVRILNFITCKKGYWQSSHRIFSNTLRVVCSFPAIMCGVQLRQIVFTPKFGVGADSNKISIIMI